MLRAESTPAEKKRPSSLAVPGGALPIFVQHRSEARGRALSAFEAGAKQKMPRTNPTEAWSHHT